MQIRVDQFKEGGGGCGCGRSPTGVCIGWHGLDEGAYREALAEWELEDLAKRTQNTKEQE